MVIGKVLHKLWKYLVIIDKAIEVLWKVHVVFKVLMVLQEVSSGPLRGFGGH